MALLVLALGIVRQTAGKSSRQLSASTMAMAFKVLRPILLLGPVAGLLGALQQSFMRGFTLALSSDGRFAHLGTHTYAILGASLASG